MLVNLPCRSTQLNISLKNNEQNEDHSKLIKLETICNDLWVLVVHTHTNNVNVVILVTPIGSVYILGW